jgi:cell wall-associated NlpC family hydrolase
MTHSKRYKLAITAVLLVALFATSAMAAKVTATANVNVRRKASTSSTRLTTMPKGTTRTVLAVSKNGQWYKIKMNGKTGYVNKAYVSSGSTAASNSDFYSNVCTKAKSLLGKRYVWGATGPNSFDCSGYTQYIYKYCGKSIPRTSASQYASCKKVSRSNLKPGYLVFFSSTAGGRSVGHVGVYIGNNKIAHAANSSAGVITSNLNSSYYSSHYVGAGYY